VARRLRGTPAPTFPNQPVAAPDTIEATRYYFHAFIGALKDCGHRPENVKAVMRELLASVRSSLKDDPT
jgi:hypothetical protein